MTSLRLLGRVPGLLFAVQQISLSTESVLQRVALRQEPLVIILYGPSTKVVEETVKSLNPEGSCLTEKTGM